MHDSILATFPWTPGPVMRNMLKNDIAWLNYAALYDKSLSYCETPQIVKALHLHHSPPI